MKRVILVVCVVVLGSAGFVAYQVLSPQPPVAKPMPPADAAREAASFDQKWDALHSKAPDSKGVTVQVSQDEVTAKVNQMIGGGDKPVKNVAVKVEQDAAVVSAVVQVGGQEIPIEATVKAAADGGLLNLDVTSLKTGNLPLPDAVKDQILQQAKQAIGKGGLNGIDLGVDLKNVKLVNGKVVIDGQAR
ncbi:MAG: hypothetical protein M1380_01755 [Chloroflexi bacterium]|nr:hypothetical protein [Chloroflexota bacterium]